MESFTKTHYKDKSIRSLVQQKDIEIYTWNWPQSNSQNCQLLSNGSPSFERKHTNQKPKIFLFLTVATAVIVVAGQNRCQWTNNATWHTWQRPNGRNSKWTLILIILSIQKKDKKKQTNKLKQLKSWKTMQKMTTTIRYKDTHTLKITRINVYYSEILPEMVNNFIDCWTHFHINRIKWNENQQQQHL